MKKPHIVLHNYNPSFVAELNTWQDIERARGENGLTRFVGDSTVPLGDYLKYVKEELGIETVVAIDDGNIVGFVSYEIKKDNSAYIEIMGTNPNFRKQGYARKMIEQLKESLSVKYGITKLTLKVKENNENGIKAFSKILNKTGKTGTYEEYEV